MKKRIKTLIITFIILVLAVAGIITGLTIRKRINDRTVRIAFYGISAEIVTEIKKYIPEEEKIIIKYDVIAPGNVDLGVVSKKYDLLFTWKGEVTDSLADSAENIPGKVLENIPMSLRNKAYLPLLLDHFELDVNTTVAAKLDYSELVTFDDFLSYLKDSSNVVFSPFFCEGGDDRSLLAFIGSIVEAEGGVEAYNKLISAMRGASSLDGFIDVPLYGSGDSVLTIRYILDMLKAWPNEGLTHPQWFYGNKVDLNVFAQEKQLAVFFTNLSTHRTMPYKTVSEFQTISFPRADENIPHGIIAPAICAMLLSDNSNCKEYLKNLMTADVQSAMSLITMLGPVHYRGESYDVQADDVRFWAASCAGGALPDLTLAVYQRKPDLQATVAAEIRSYLKN